MAASAKAGSVTTANTSGNQAFTGVGFQPKALLTFTSLIPANTFTAHARGSIGFGTSSTARFAVGFRADDNQITPNGQRWRDDTAIGMLLGATNNTIDLVSLDADGFTLNFSAAPGTNQIGYLALGGTDLSAKVSTFNLDQTGPTQQITGVGFKPDAVIFLWAAKGSDGLQTSFGAIGMGVTCATGDAAINMFSQNSVGDTNASRSFWNAECIALDSNGSTGDRGYASLASLDTDGFTLNIDDTAGAADMKIGYLAIKGFSADVGSDTQKTSTGTKATTVAIQPAAGVLLATYDTSTGFFVDSDAKISVGAFDSTPNNAHLWIADRENVGTSEADRYTANAKAIGFRSPGAPTTATTEAEAGVSAVSASSFTLDWTTADATARNFAYLVLGAPSFNKTGAGVAGLTGSGADALMFVEAGRGLVGMVGSGAEQFSGAITFLKAGFAIAGTVGVGAKDYAHVGASTAKAGHGIVGATATSTSGLATNVVYEGIVIAFGSDMLDPYPTWTRIDQ